MNPHLSTLSQNKFVFFFDPFRPSPMLSAVNKTLRQKTLSVVAMAIAYAALGYAFYFLFFASQL